MHKGLGIPTSSTYSRLDMYFRTRSIGSIWVKLFVAMIVGSTFHLCHGQSMLSFCDREDLFVINEGDCTGGINFGSRKPDCVCMTGVYRSWAEGCEIYDGFIHEFCTEVKGDDLSIVGIKLLTGIADVYRDTAAVFGEEVTDDQNWSAYLVGMEGITKSDSIYTLNGFPVVLQRGQDRFICVEPQKRMKQHVCRFYSYENKGVWIMDNGRIKVKVMHSCDPRNDPYLKDYAIAEVKPHRCYDIMDRNVSECQLQCEQGRRKMLPGSQGLRAKKSLPGGVAGTRMDADDDEESMLASSQEVIPDASSNANFFLHRKLNKYIRMRQVGILKRPDLSQSAPNRTFTLLDIASRVARITCPSMFVSDVFLEHALELFLLLHKGQDYRYIEDVEYRDFKWIQEILLSCRTDILKNRLTFRGEPTHEGCEHDGLIGETCVQVQDQLLCKPVKGGLHHQVGKFHYVIDAVWNIIDMTHVLCYPSFVKSFRMFHIWEQASEKLFTRDLRNLWHKPEVDLRVYDSLLSDKAMIDMINLERCVEASYSIYSLPRLVRPARFKTQFRRRKRAVSENPQSIAKAVDVYCAKSEDDFVDGC